MKSITKMNFKDYMSLMFSLDLRSLALMRILVGVILLCDLWTRSQYLVLFYTDAGALPRTALLTIYHNNVPLSLHFAFGSILGEGVLFFLAVYFALNLLVGNKVQLFTILSWLMLRSLDNRNLLILNSGDIYLGIIMFLGLFLPWGEKFSLKRPKTVNEDKSSSTVLSLATFAFIVQVICVYVFSGILKWKTIWWTKGQALFFAVSMQEISRPMARWLLDFPHGLEHLSKAIPYLEIFVPFLILVPLFNYTWRLAAILFLIFFHIGTWLIFDIEYFPFICIAALAGLLPPTIWDKKQYHIPVRHRMNKLAMLCIVVFLTFSLAGNFQRAGFKIPLRALPRGVAMFFNINQNWNMFTDFPHYSSHYLLEGMLYGGGTLVEPVPPEERMRKFITRINYQNKHKDLLGKFWGDYICKRWNAQSPSMGTKLKNVQLTQTITPIGLNQQSIVKQKFVIFNDDCPVSQTKP